MLDGSIRGNRALKAITGVEPLIVIPYIQNQEDKDRTRKNLINFSVVVVVLLLGMVAALHIFYMPLDTLWYKAWNRLGQM